MSRQCSYTYANKFYVTPNFAYDRLLKEGKIHSELEYIRNSCVFAVVQFLLFFWKNVSNVYSFYNWNFSIFILFIFIYRITNARGVIHQPFVNGQTLDARRHLVQRLRLINTQYGLRGHFGLYQKCSEKITNCQYQKL